MNPTAQHRMDVLLRLRREVWTTYPDTSDARVMFWALSNAIDTLFTNIHPNTTDQLIGALDHA